MAKAGKANKAKQGEGGQKEAPDELQRDNTFGYGYFRIKIYDVTTHI